MTSVVATAVAAAGISAVGASAASASSLSSAISNLTMDARIKPVSSADHAPVFDSVIGRNAQATPAAQPTAGAQLDSVEIRVPGFTDGPAQTAAHKSPPASTASHVIGVIGTWAASHPLPDTDDRGTSSTQSAQSAPVKWAPAPAAPAYAAPAQPAHAAPTPAKQPAPAQHPAPAAPAHGHAAQAAPAQHAQAQPAVTKPYLIYDSVTPTAIPPNQIVATYANGSYAASPSDVAGRGHVLWIDTNGSDPNADALDVEPGDATPYGAALWVKAKLSADPKGVAIVYTMISEWQAVKDNVAGLPQWMQDKVRYWIADPTGVPHVLPGSNATQWYWGSSYDITTANPGFQG
jgi:hypothetical protein